jgi:AcrR family transcriptional regulator
MPQPCSQPRAGGRAAVGTLSGVTPADDQDAAPARRRYDSPVRRQRAAETRERIVAAGSDLVHEFSSWDWRELTFRAVAERAGVGQRTVYRHFPTERHLHEAVMRRLHEEAGVDYGGVELSSLTDLTGRIFASLHAYAAEQAVLEPDDPTFHAVDEQRRAALRRAVDEAAPPAWTDEQRETVAAALDVLWHLPSYERLVSAWRFDGERATATISWLIDLVRAAVDRGEAPPGH